MKWLILKILIIAIPTYTVAFITEKMVFTIPMLAITTIIATYKNIEHVEPAMTMTFKFSSVEDFEHFHRLVKERIYDGERVLRGTQKETEKYSWWPLRETAGEFKYVDEE